MSEAENIGLAPEWSHLVDITELDESNFSVQIQAPEAARELLIKRLGVEGLSELSADLKLSRSAGELVVYVKGTLSALVQQICVRSNELIEKQVNGDVEGWFSDHEQAISFAKEKRNKLYEKGHGEAPILEDEDDPDAIVDGKIELGELVVQHLSLEIETYPRGADVEYENGDDKGGKASSELRKNPFAALKDWKHKQEGE